MNCKKIRKKIIKAAFFAVQNVVTALGLWDTNRSKFSLTSLGNSDVGPTFPLILVGVNLS